MTPLQGMDAWDVNIVIRMIEDITNALSVLKVMKTLMSLEIFIYK